MAQDTREVIAHRVLLHAPDAGIERCRHWVDQAFRRLSETRAWSWRVRWGQFLIPSVYATGTATATRGQNTVTFSGATITADHVGLQFRIGNSPLYTIAKYLSSTSVELDKNWGEDNQSAKGYEIYQAFYTVPDDFHSFISIANMRAGYQLDFTTYEQRMLDQEDPQRSSTSDPDYAVFRDYSSSYIGSVEQPVIVLGTGNKPSAAGQYTGPIDAVFTIEITTGGASGTAIFKWKKNEGSYTTGVVSDANAIDLSDGTQIYFPVQTYTISNIFVIRTTAGSSPGVPRYELYPHPQVQTVIPYLYLARIGDLGDTNFVIPRTIGDRGDILIEGALGYCARWPGESAEKRNPYFQIALAEAHERHFNKLLEFLQREDDSIYPQDVSYYVSLPGRSRHTADWYQKHS